MEFRKLRPLGRMNSDRMPVSIPVSLIDILSWDVKALAHLATIGPDGGPQTSPVWFHQEDDLLQVSVYENSQKMRNIQRDPRISVSVVDPGDPYRYLELREAVVGTHRDPQLGFLTRMSGKYLGLDHYPWAREHDVEVVLSIEPHRVSGMGGG